MSAPRERPQARTAAGRQPATQRARLAEAEATLRAIRLGEVDAVVVASRRGPQVYTLEGAGHAYRLLIESMNEGALTLAADQTILYANQCFARMVRCPLEQVIGSSLHRFLTPAAQAVLRPILRRTNRAGGKLLVDLNAIQGPKLPVQVSIRWLARDGGNRAPVGLVVTDLTEARRTEGLLRALAHRVVQVQETERKRLALQLHNRVTQQLCAVHLSSLALQNRLADQAAPAKRAAARLHRLLQRTAGAVERISQELRPSALDHLGLAAVLREAAEKFAGRTGIAVRMTSRSTVPTLPPDSELTLYRIFQEALKNIERHARAGHVQVRLGLSGACVQLTVKDDGRGPAGRVVCRPSAPPRRNTGQGAAAHAGGPGIFTYPPPDGDRFRCPSLTLALATCRHVWHKTQAAGGCDHEIKTPHQTFVPPPA